VLFKEDNAKFSGKVSVKKRGITAIDSLPGFLLSIISSIEIKNPNPFPIRKKFGFLSFGGDYGTRLLNLPLGANS